MTLHLPLFLAKRIYLADDATREVSRPAVRIATVGVAIGLAVMIVTVSVVFGFKHTIRDKVAGFGSHIQVSSLAALQTGSPVPVCLSDTLIRQLGALPGVRHVERYAMAQGILKTDSDFLGVAFKGIGADYDATFIRQNMLEGVVPDFGRDESRYQLLLSQLMADKLRLRVGDAVYAYFIDESVRMRKFTVSGIYHTDMRQFDESLCFISYATAQRLNRWESDLSSGAELLVGHFDQIPLVAEAVGQVVNRNTDRYGQSLTSLTIYESYPQIFSWLSLLDINVWIILVLMVCVAGFTMVSGLLIIILERTQMIGILKALGARNATVRHTFLWLGVFIVGRGLLLGNVLGIGLVLLQQSTGIVRLDPASYYVDTAPMELSLPIVLLLNGFTLVTSVVVLIAPSLMVSHIDPARSMRYE